MKKLLTIICLCWVVIGYGQIDPILVTEQTLKISGEEKLLYGFCKGDEIVFDLNLIKGKNLKEVEVAEINSSSKLFEYKINKLKDKRIKVLKTGIYVFRFKSGGVGGKICRVTIKRIPVNEETISFDPTIKWKTRLDSTYLTKYRKDIVNVDTIVVPICNRTERVHSQTNLDNPNTSNFQLRLPQNQYNDLETSELVSWAYWIGVGNEGEEAFRQEQQNFVKSAGNIAANAILGSNPLAGLAANAFSMSYRPPNGSNVHYVIGGTSQQGYTRIAEGNSVVANGRVENFKQGQILVTLTNDNIMNGINVNIKASAIVIKKSYKKTPYEELKVKKTLYPSLTTNY